MACAHHLEALEAYSCTQCGSLLCTQCVKRVGFSHRYICIDCGHEARAARPSRADESLTTDIFRRLASIETLATAIAFAIFYALSLLFTLLVVFYFAALVAYYFAIVRHVGAAKPGLPGPSDATEDWIEIGGFVLRGMLCAALAVAPLIIYFAVVRHPPSPLLAVVLVAAGQLYAPAMLLAVAYTDTLFATLWPVAWVQIVMRAPVAYLKFLGIWIASLVAGALVAIASDPLVEIGMTGMLVASIVWNLYWFAQAVIVGDFLRTNARDLGYE